MVKMPSPPRFREKSFDCPHCGAFAAQDWRWLHYPIGTDEYNQEYCEAISDSNAPADRPNSRTGRWFASLCSACEDHSLWISGKLVHPASGIQLGIPAPAEGMPHDVAALYKEAAAVLPHSRRAAAALCRASLERLAKCLTPDAPTKTSLDERLILLNDKTTASLAMGLQIIRHTGNTALHGARDDDESVVIYMGEGDTDIVELFFVTINELVDELITRPARLEAAYNLIPKEKREAVERKIQQARSLNG